MDGAPNVRLRLLGTSANVTLVRRVLEGVASLLGLSALEADALQTAVEEVCKNVVHHAYDGVEGPLELELWAAGPRTDAIVRDGGIGIRPSLGERRQPHVGIGLPMVHALTRRVTYTNLDGGGTEVLMEFETPNARALDPARAWAPEAPALAAPWPPGPPAAAQRRDLETRAESLELVLAPLALARHVLPGVLAALAERAGLDGADAGTVRALATLAPALAERTCEALCGDQLWLEARAAGGLELALRPLRTGAGERVCAALREQAPTLELASEQAGDGREHETLALSLGGGRAEG